MYSSKHFSISIQCQRCSAQVAVIVIEGGLLQIFCQNCKISEQIYDPTGIHFNSNWNFKPIISKEEDED